MNAINNNFNSTAYAKLLRREFNFKQDLEMESVTENKMKMLARDCVLFCLAAFQAALFYL